MVNLVNDRDIVPVSIIKVTEPPIGHPPAAQANILLAYPQAKHCAHPHRMHESEVLVTVPADPGPTKRTGQPITHSPPSSSHCGRSKRQERLVECLTALHIAFTQSLQSFSH